MRAVERTFAPDAASVGAAREWLGAQIRAWEVSELDWTAGLVLSELATNAVLHAGTPFAVSAVLLPDGALRLVVSDGVRRAPRRRDYGPQATTGRGVALVAALSRAWGVDKLADGKHIWCEIDSSTAEPELVPDLDSFLSPDDLGPFADSA